MYLVWKASQAYGILGQILLGNRVLRISGTAVPRLKNPWYGSSFFSLNSLGMSWNVIDLLIQEEM